MNPTSTKTSGTPSRIKRRVFCAHYSDCLDLAVTEGWKGFTCRRCSDYQEETFDQATGQKEAERCGRLLKAIFIDKPKKGPGNYRSKPSIPTHEELVVFWKEDRPGEPVPDRLSIPWLDGFLVGR